VDDPALVAARGGRQRPAVLEHPQRALEGSGADVVLAQVLGVGGQRRARAEGERVDRQTADGRVQRAAERWTCRVDARRHPPIVLDAAEVPRKALTRPRRTAIVRKRITPNLEYCPTKNGSP